MANCANCGTPLKAGSKFCTSCGTAVTASPVKTTAAANTAKVVQPVQQPMPAAVWTSEVISTPGWIGYMLLLAIPIIGIVLYFVWAFSAGGNINRRNYCRAALIMMAVSIVLGIIFSAAIAASVASIGLW